jgi:oxaloacetate decarboxylase gamma subunit
VDNLSELLSAGLNVTLIGMLVVFVLLGVLIGVVRAMSALAELLQTSGSALAPAAAIEPVPDDDDLIVVISAAIRRYRQDRAARNS